MNYIIMCGGNYEFQKPLVKINGETLVERTIRLLRENGIEDIYVSTNSEQYEFLDVPLLHHKNTYEHDVEIGQPKGCWLEAYYPTEEPTCYLHGDVFFSHEAIKQIIEAKGDLFICTCDGNDKRFKRHPMNTGGREPFGYKVENQRKFREGIDYLISIQDEFYIKPFSWHLYRYLNGLDLCKKARSFTKINNIFREDGNYLLINDYTRDVDTPGQVKALEEDLKKWGINV